MQRRTLTRAELHAMVWEKPLRTLAGELGVSDVGLSKICKRHAVPTPPQGHWTRVQMGKPASAAAPLPEIDDPALQTIEIMPQGALAPARARVEIGELLTKRKAERAEQTTLKNDRSELHPALRASATKLRTAGSGYAEVASARGEGMCGIVCRGEDVERIVAFLDELFRKFDERGLVIEPAGDKMIARRERDQVRFCLQTKFETQQYIPTKAERQAEEERLARKAREERLYGRTSWDIGLSGRAYPETHQVPSGKYAIHIESWSHGLRRTWADGKMQTLESMVHAIATGIEACLLAAKGWREEQEERERAYQERERRRALAAKWREREEKRLAFVERLVDRRSETSRLENWLAQAPVEETSPAYARLVAWLRARMDVLRRQSDPSWIAAELERQQLFPELDELAEGAPDA